jgi:aldehyde dehydrogenase (NAD+)
MITIANQFGMKEALAQLGIKEINEGTSTGLNHFSNGAILESYSPVDGQLIAKVKTSTAADYEKSGVRYRSFQNIQIDAGTATW